MAFLDKLKKVFRWVRRIGFIVTLFIPKVFITLAIIGASVSLTVMTDRTSMLEFATIYTGTALMVGLAIAIVYIIVTDAVPWSAINGGIFSCFGVYVAMLVDRMLAYADSPEFKDMSKTKEGQYMKSTMFVAVAGAVFGSFIQYIPSLV